MFYFFKFSGRRDSMRMLEVISSVWEVKEDGWWFFVCLFFWNKNEIGRYVLMC